MKTITVTNLKGGVGKTALTAALGAFFAEKKRLRTLVVDLDGQRSLSFLIGHRTDFEKNVLDVAAGEPLGACIVQCGKRLDLLPATAGLYLAQPQPDTLRNLRAAFSGYDIVLFDTPPALGSVSMAAMCAADYVLCPSQADLLSVNAFGDLADTINQVIEAAKTETKLLGVVLTRFTPRMTISREIEAAFAQVAEAAGTRLLSSKIRESNAFREAQCSLKSIFEIGRNNAADDVAALGNELLKLTKKA